jgi:hypothetical protein
MVLKHLVITVTDMDIMGRSANMVMDIIQRKDDIK